MTISPISRWFAVAGLAACVLLAGCSSGPKLYKVSGKLTKGGKPLEVNAMTGRLNVVFRPSGTTGGEPMYANMKPDGSFTVPGPDGKGIPAGKYRITVQQFDPFNSNPQQAVDKLGGKFDERNSKIEREVTGSSDHFEIELDKES